MTSLRATLLYSLTFAAAACAVATQAGMPPAGPPVPDPRIGLRAGYLDAAQASWNLQLVAHRPRPERFFDPAQPGSFAFANADLAFSGNYVFQGGFNGIQVWDISDPRNPRIRSTIICPGGQGDPSVYRNLLFMSVEETRGRLDCGAQGVTDTVSAERFRGVRIFDISDIDRPKSVASVQTCRGSHTHTIVSHPADRANLYVYVAGTSPPRPGAELAGCSGLPPEQDPNTSLFRIEVIRVPLAAPQEARIVNMPRIFANAAGNIAGLWPGGAHGEGTQTTAQTNQCHDITAYSAIGLAAGACSGNGILLDIRDPVNPRRIAEVSDPNFAYWHSATFSNDGRKVIFTDEWGGGTAPRCRATDRPQWGANAIYTFENGQLRFQSFYKLPAPQTAQENCVAHNGSLIPVPGRDIMVQGWYQGGVSVFDFTDPRRPVEIAFFDRGPLSETQLMLGGHWSAYWYNGRIYASEIARGLDVLELRPSAHLSANEIAAAQLVRWDYFNAQDQQRITWPPSFVVARAYLDQLRRNRGLSGRRLTAIARDLERAERMAGDQQRAALTTLASQLEAEAARANDATRVRAMAAAVREIANRR
ncbi:MAG: LVIVD repeat-containing protein [Gemmatimonadaceae bacterium]